MKNLNVPNVISIVRIILTPVMLACIVMNNEQVFTWMLFAALISDILDGLIARIFKLHTELGARLDSIGDLGMYACAVTGIFGFKWEFLAENFAVIFVVIGFFLLARIFTFIRYKKVFNNFHSYSSKLMAYAQGIFIMTLFLFGYKPYLFYPACMIGILANIEEYLLLCLLPVEKTNVKGLYWVLKEKNKAGS